MIGKRKKGRCASVTQREAYEGNKGQSYRIHKTKTPSLYMKQGATSAALSGGPTRRQGLRHERVARVLPRILKPYNSPTVYIPSFSPHVQVITLWSRTMSFRSPTSFHTRLVYHPSLSRCYSTKSPLPEVIRSHVHPHLVSLRTNLTVRTRQAVSSLAHHAAIAGLKLNEVTGYEQVERLKAQVAAQGTPRMPAAAHCRTRLGTRKKGRKGG